MKVALIQQKFHGTKDATVQRTLELVREASGGGAELVAPDAVFLPERGDEVF